MTHFLISGYLSSTRTCQDKNRTASNWFLLVAQTKKHFFQRPIVRLSSAPSRITWQSPPYIEFHHSHTFRADILITLTLLRLRRSCPIEHANLESHVAWRWSVVCYCSTCVNLRRNPDLIGLTGLKLLTHDSGNHATQSKLITLTKKKRNSATSDLPRKNRKKRKKERKKTTTEKQRVTPVCPPKAKIDGQNNGLCWHPPAGDLWYMASRCPQDSTLSVCTQGDNQREKNLSCKIE